MGKPAQNIQPGQPGPVPGIPERFPQIRDPNAPATPIPLGQGGFFGAGQDFLSGLLRGQLPESVYAATQRSSDLARQGLNAELQKRGAFFGTPGLQMQRDLSETMGTNLNNMIFGNAMQAIPQGMGLFGGAAGLAGMPNQLPEWFGGGTQLLNALRGQVTQPMYAPDPFTQIIGSLLPFLF